MTRASNKTMQLAGQAATLSGELYALQERCKHESTAGEMSSVADELARLSTTLWTLNDAITTSPDQYTDAFNEDLAEITTELASVIEEISDCCNDLQSADSTTSSVPWFFKQGRVSRLVKHLDALKGTLMIMRTVLFHGKDYGTHKSSRLAESSPHTMHEDRIILESLLARNREAILNMHKLTEIATATRTNSRPQSPERAGHHHRELSDSTGVEISPTPDVLPPIEGAMQDDSLNAHPVQLGRTFTKRGARLGVHMSIMDAGAHTAPHQLKEKWLQQASRRQDLNLAHRTACGVLTAKPELSRISEVDTSAGSSTNLGRLPLHESIMLEGPDTLAHGKTSSLDSNTPVSSGATEIAQERNRTVVAGNVRRALSRLSMGNLRASRATQRSDGEANLDDHRGKENKHGRHHIRHKSDGATFGTRSTLKDNRISDGKHTFFKSFTKRVDSGSSLDAVEV